MFPELIVGLFWSSIVLFLIYISRSLLQDVIVDSHIDQYAKVYDIGNVVPITRSIIMFTSRDYLDRSCPGMVLGYHNKLLKVES